MDSLINDTNFSFGCIGVADGEVKHKFTSEELITEMAEAAHACGDPGIQFKDTINEMHTVKNDGPINASNPCSEFLFLDDTACNLASINLIKFISKDDTGGFIFDTKKFELCVSIMIMAQEILVGRAKYPTEKITENSKKYRPLGLGFSNLGGMLMSMGVGYDSKKGRDIAGAIASLMSAAAYRQSALMASNMGSCDGYANNAIPFREVIIKHENANWVSTEIDSNAIDVVNKLDMTYLIRKEAAVAWDKAIQVGDEYGYRNSQVTVIAPTGTISFMMDCDTTGIEPELALLKYKTLVGGGEITYDVPESVRSGLIALSGSHDVDPYAVNDVIDRLRSGVSIIDAMGPTTDSSVFLTSLPDARGRSLSWKAHVKMMAAVQPYISGGISKTINMPNDATVEDIIDVYKYAYTVGLKCIAIYRDGSKGVQPMNIKKVELLETDIVGVSTVSMPTSHETVEGPPVYNRKRLPVTRKSVTHKFSVGNVEGYIIVGEYPDGSPGEVFINVSQEGTMVSGLMDTIGTLISIGLQSGVPLNVMSDKFRGASFEPSAWSEGTYYRSIIDYIFTWLSEHTIQRNKIEFVDTGITVSSVEPDEFSEENNEVTFTNITIEPATKKISHTQVCSCGFTMIRAGSCFECRNCGENTGCG